MFLLAFFRRDIGGDILCILSCKAGRIGGTNVPAGHFFLQVAHASWDVSWLAIATIPDCCCTLLFMLDVLAWAKYQCAGKPCELHHAQHGGINMKSWGNGFKSANTPLHASHGADPF